MKKVLLSVSLLLVLTGAAYWYFGQQTMPITEPSIAVSGDFSGRPGSGEAPLTVNFSAPTTGGDYTVDFGDSKEGSMAGFCREGNCTNFRPSTTHTYTAKGTYDVKFKTVNYKCSETEGPGCVSEKIEKVLGELTITVL